MERIENGNGFRKRFEVAYSFEFSGQNTGNLTIGLGRGASFFPFCGTGAKVYIPVKIEKGALIYDTEKAHFETGESLKFRDKARSALENNLQELFLEISKLTDMTLGKLPSRGRYTFVVETPTNPRLAGKSVRNDSSGNGKQVRRGCTDFI